MNTIYLAGLLMSLSLLVACIMILVVLKMYRTYLTIQEIGQEEYERRKQQEQEDRQLYRAIMLEARYLAKVIPEHLAIQNRLVANWNEYPKGKRRRKKQLLTFDVCLVTKTEIWFHFNGSKLPYGVSFADIKSTSNNVLTNLQYAIHRTCRWHEDDRYNLFLRVGLRNSVMGIPKRVEWSKIYPELPKARSFAVAIGVNDTGQMVYQDIRKWPHGLVLGSSGQGKSTQLLQWIITLIKRNSPEELLFCFVDLKEGIELGRFKNIPHTKYFVDRKEDVQEVLDWLVGERERRMKMFSGVCQDLDGWNAQRSKLPYILLIIDELFDITTTPSIAKKSVETLSELARKGRAAGINMIGCTQILEAKVLPLEIRGNFPGRVVFSVPGHDESRLALGSSLAVGLEPQGRCVYRTGSGHVYCQAPIASAGEIDQAIEGAINGRVSPEVEEDGLALLKVALYNMGGIADYNQLYDALSGEMSQKAIRTKLKRFEYRVSEQLPVIEMDGSNYILSPAIKERNGTLPRRLLLVNGHLPSNKAELRELARRQTANGIEIDSEVTVQDPKNPTEEKEDVTVV